MAVLEIDSGDLGGVLLRLAELEVVNGTNLGDDGSTLRLELGDNVLENFGGFKGGHLFFYNLNLC